MLAEQLINEEIPVLSPSDKVSKALGLMDDYKLSHLTIVDDGIYKGMIDENSLYNCEDDSTSLTSLTKDYKMAFVLNHQHLFEVIKKVSDFQISSIPVINAQSKYLGGITLKLLMETIAEMPVVKTPGAIIVLEMSMSDYSLFEISRIVEEDNAKILGSFITRFPDSTKMELTIKLNVENVQSIMSSLERFKYTITASYNKKLVNDNLNDRYDQLMKYLNM